MLNTNGSIKKEVVHRIISEFGFIKDLQISTGGRYFAGLDKDGDLLTTVFDFENGGNLQSTITGPIQTFALRPNVSEVAVADRNSNFIERFTMLTEVRPKSIQFSDVTALCYNESGSFLAAGSASGTVRLYSLEEDGPARLIVESHIAKERVTKVAFGFDNIIVLTVSGGCYRVPLRFAQVPRVQLRVSPEPRLVAADGKTIEWNCYAYAHHPTLSLEAFGGEFGILVSQHEIFGSCGVKQTGLGRFIHKLSFCERTGRLIAMGEKGVQIWSVHNSVMHEKWQVGGDLSKLGRMAATVKVLEESFTAPEAGLRPLAYTVLHNAPTVFWG